MGAVPLLAVVAAVAWAAPALGHELEPTAALTRLGQWNLAPWLVAVMATAATLYALGVARLWRHAGRLRGISGGQTAAFAAGWLALAAALLSPLDRWGTLLFSAHMLQHELLMIVAAPLLVLGRPLAAWTWALAPPLRRLAGRATRARWFASVWGAITQPLAAWALHALALWLWHLPAWFDAALRSEALHIAQHASFLATALLFWWAVLGKNSGSRNTGFALASLFTTMLHTSALGALLALAPAAWYSGYAASSADLGLGPLQDQQLGGLVMWVPGSAAYLVAALAIVARLLAHGAVSPATATRPGLPR